MVTKRILILLNIVFWSVFLFNHLDVQSPAKTAPTENHRNLQTNATEKNTDLGVTFLDFSDKYHALLLKYKIPQFGLNNLRWEEKQSKKTFFCDFGNTVIIFGDVDTQTEKLLNITVGCEPNKTANKKLSVKKAAFIHALAIKALNPSLTKSELTAISKTLGNNLKNNSVVDGKVKYKSTVYNEILLLSIEPT